MFINNWHACNNKCLTGKLCRLFSMTNCHVSISICSPIEKSFIHTCFFDKRQMCVLRVDSDIRRNNTNVLLTCLQINLLYDAHLGMILFFIISFVTADMYDVGTRYPLDTIRFFGLPLSVSRQILSQSTSDKAEKKS